MGRCVDLYGVSGFRVMTDRLAMSADGVYLPGIHAGPIQQLLHGGGVQASQLDAGQRCSFQFIRAGVIERQKFSPEAGWHGHGCRRYDGWPVRVMEAGKNPVDAICAGARHQANIVWPRKAALVAPLRHQSFASDMPSACSWATSWIWSRYCAATCLNLLRSS